MRIQAVRDVTHALTGRFARGPETFCIIKVEDTFKGRTRATRTDKWTDEYHQVEVDKANEIEVTVYDKTGTYPTPIGMLWIRISDLVEEMRRKKIESELSGSQWVTAEQMAKGGRNMPSGLTASASVSSGQTLVNQPSVASRGGPGSASPGEANDPNVIDAWFSLEPVGMIKLAMSFSMLVPRRKLILWLTDGSETQQGKAEFRCRIRAKRCRSATQRGGHGAVRPQVPHAAVLQHHAMRALWRIPQECRGYAVRGLQIYLSQELFSQSGY